MGMFADINLYEAKKELAKAREALAKRDDLIRRMAISMKSLKWDGAGKEFRRAEQLISEANDLLGVKP